MDAWLACQLDDEQPMHAVQVQVQHPAHFVEAAANSNWMRLSEYYLYVYVICLPVTV